MIQRQSGKIDLSIVATIYNDAELIPILVKEIEKAVRSLQIDYEIILVNDCSADSSDQAIKDICQLNNRVKGISLARNYGQQLE